MALGLLRECLDFLSLKQVRPSQHDQDLRVVFYANCRPFFLTCFGVQMIDSDDFLNETKTPSQVKRKITMDKSTKLSTFVCNSRSIIMGNS